MGNCSSFQLGCDPLTARCWDCVAAEAIFVCHLEENIADLRTAKDKLVAHKADVMRMISLEETGEMERLPQVDNWRRRVETLVGQVDELLQTAPEEISRLCLGGCCSSSYFSSYNYGKKVARKLKEVRDEDGQVFNGVVGMAQARPVVQRNVGSASTVGMESTVDRAWGLLMDNQVDTLGIWGMGGVGKTTLLDHINNKFCQVPDDYVVIYVVVSKEFTIDKVQDDIWKRLGFSVEEPWKSKTRQEKADAIFYKLNEKKFVLLLDDVWEQINLANDIGVPRERNGSKVVFTTRDEDVCGQMGAKEQVKVDPLSWEQAWELFEQVVGRVTLNSHPDIPPLAQRVAKKCAGLPIALITVGSSMARKRTPQEWKDDFERLQMCASHFRGMNNVLGLLKFSYESLPDNDATRPCFLYCCLFPEDYKIPKRDLVDYWVGEGFCTSPGNGYGYIGTLVRACLLEEEGDHVQLHDMVRELALWIARECEDENERFLVQTGKRLTEIVEFESWRTKKRVSLMDNRIESPNEAPICPNLQTLFLCRNKFVVNQINSAFFGSMAALRVLDLSWNYHQLSIRSNTLDFSALTSLQYLNLSHTNIKFWPPQFEMLVNLKYLNLEYNSSLLKIQRNLTSNFSCLQVLRMHECRFNHLDGNLLEELRRLPQLNILTTTIRQASTLKTLSSDTKLVSCIQVLSLEKLVGSGSLDISSSFADMVHLEELHVVAIDMAELSVDSGGIQRILKNRSFNNLRKLEVVACQYLLDLTWVVLVPNLAFLSLLNCQSMKEVINPGKFVEISAAVQQQFHPFAKLEVLRLISLPKLEIIINSSQRLPSLREIFVNGCSMLKELPLTRFQQR